MQGLKKLCALTVIAVLMLSLFGGCGYGEKPVPVTGVTLDNTSLMLVLGSDAAAQLTATVGPDSASDKSVSWVSSNIDVVTAGNDGTVTAVGVGEAAITVTTTDGGHKATCAVTVISTHLAELAGEEARLSFNALWEQAQTQPGHPAYGMVFDRYPSNPNLASIASVGFFLGTLPGAVEEEWVTYEDAYARALGTMDTILYLENFSGFYYHFIDMRTGLRAGNSEVSVIDTGMMIAGVIAAGEYFGGEIWKKADEIYSRIDWNFYTGDNNGKKQFRMGYQPGAEGFSGFWDWSAEQLVLYVLGAGAPNKAYRTEKEMFYNFNRPVGSYNDGPEFIYSYDGSLFTHQHSHAFVDFRGKVDGQGVDWHDNSVKATKNDRNYVIDNQDKFASWHENSWGLTACDTPRGYSGKMGALPSAANDIKNDGTISPCGALGSTPFAPVEVLTALEHYRSIDELQTEKYGLKDAYNINSDGTEWYAPDILGLNKGITVLMLQNFLYDGIVWKYFMQNRYMQAAMDRLGFIGC